MELNKGLYLDLVRRAEEIGSENENLEIIERGNAIFFLIAINIKLHCVY